MAFHVGQRVVCVDASLPANPWHRQFPLVKNRIYVVSDVSCISSNPGVSIDGSRRIWPCTRFRPIVEKKTDIAIFTALLTPKQRELVDSLPPSTKGERE